ncbi:hypothetical protein [Rossellomorea aquimaris]|uniref:hypothetical protein n=1 Tax=Rossellomorea aquimaris TaxID=189382 RepID=UPI00292A3EAF|nr:hypothetical protein [Rossellomorea aquimaris]
MKYNKIRWGIIGCGEVTEKKSGPAFKKLKTRNLWRSCGERVGWQGIMRKDIRSRSGTMMRMH